MRYPVTVTAHAGELLLRFPDIPGAETSVPASAPLGTQRQGAQACLVAALGQYAAKGRGRPKPSSGKMMIDVPVLQQAKLALIWALVRSDFSQRGFAAHIDVDPKQVQRLLNLEHRSHISDVEEALSVLGHRLSLSVSRD